MTGDTQRFYGRGKLLITGEYVVLDGAEALAVPTQLGQWLRYREIPAMKGLLIWIASNHDKTVWRQMSFDLRDFRCLEGADAVGLKLANLLFCARKLNPHFLAEEEHSIVAETQLEFPRDWGLGSSSTLVFLVSCWAKVDAQQLLQLTFGGSGYDVAAAAENGPFIFSRQQQSIQHRPVVFRPDFQPHLYLAYLGKKQDSAQAIKHYRKTATSREEIVEEISALTNAFLTAATLHDLEKVIQEHEQFVGSLINTPPIQQTYFTDFEGKVKSLGAWGGDYILLTYSHGLPALKSYLQNKGITQVFGWNDLIYDNPEMEVVFDINA